MTYVLCMGVASGPWPRPPPSGWCYVNHETYDWNWTVYERCAFVFLSMKEAMEVREYFESLRLPRSFYIEEVTGV